MATETAPVTVTGMVQGFIAFIPGHTGCEAVGEEIKIIPKLDNRKSLFLMSRQPKDIGIC